MPKLPDVLDPVSGYIALGIVILIIVLMIWVIRKMTSTRDGDVHHHPSPAPAPHHPPTGGGDHGHDDHSGGHHGHAKDPLWLWILKACAVIAALALLALIIFMIARSMGFGTVPGLPHKEREHVSDYRKVPVPTRVIPSDTVYCPIQKATPKVLEPGKSINLGIPEGSSVDVKPDSKDGVTKTCDFFNPDTCSSAAAPLKAEVVTVTNTSTHNVDVSCPFV